MTDKKKKSEITEERILEAALNLFAEKGYTGSATSEIAKGAKVSEGTIFKYFPQKKDLLRKVIYKFIEVFGEQIVMSPLEKIYADNVGERPEIMMKKIIMNRIQLFHSLKDHFKVLVVEMQYDEELKDIFVEHVAKKAMRFGEKVSTVFQEKGLWRNIPPLIMFRTFVGSILMLAIQRELAPEMTPEGLDLEQEVDIMIDLFMNGAKARGEDQ